MQGTLPIPPSVSTFHAEGKPEYLEKPTPSGRVSTTSLNVSVKSELRVHPSLLRTKPLLLKAHAHTISITLQDCHSE